jgi:cholesterol oxidase
MGTLGSATRAWARRSDFVPAVVIGSGFGGAVAALRLGQEGIDTVVLERGRRWPIRGDGNTFATFEKPDGRAYWLRERTGEAILGLPQLEKTIDRYVGVLEVIEGNGIYIGAGAGVGGGSLVFNAIIVKPRRELFERVFPREVNFDEMEEVYYPRVRRILRSAPIPDDILATDYYRSSRVSLEQARTAGFLTLSAPPVSVSCRVGHCWPLPALIERSGSGALQFPRSEQSPRATRLCGVPTWSILRTGVGWA